MEVVEELGKDETYLFSKAGLGQKAIEEVIRKHMQERRRKENNALECQEDSESGSQSSISSSSSAKKEKLKNYESYFNDG